MAGQFQPWPKPAPSNGRPAATAGDEHLPGPGVYGAIASASAPTGDALLAAVLQELLAWYSPANAKPTKALSVPPYPGVIQAVAPNPNRVGLIISVPTAATNPVYWSDNNAVSPNDTDGPAAGVPILPGASMIFGPEDRLCPTYLTTTTGGAAIVVRIGEQIATPGS